MNAMQAFFKKYHAVPGNNAGPSWSQATTEALAGWAQEDCDLWDRTHPERRDELRCRMQEIGNELYRRHEEVVEIRFEAEVIRKPAVVLWGRIFQRIGFQFANVPRKCHDAQT